MDIGKDTVTVAMRTVIDVGFCPPTITPVFTATARWFCSYGNEWVLGFFNYYLVDMCHSVFVDYFVAVMSIVD